MGISINGALEGFGPGDSPIKKSLGEYKTEKGAEMKETPCFCGKLGFEGGGGQKCK